MDYDSPRTERQQKAVNQAKNIFLILLVSGLSLGVIVSVGVIVLMNHFGLTEKSNQMKIIPERLNQETILLNYFFVNYSVSRTHEVHKTSNSAA